MTPFSQMSREQLRATYREAWRKWRERAPLQPLEAQIADVIRIHPEYHALLQGAAAAEATAPAPVLPAAAARPAPAPEMPASTPPNPFLHLGLHLALREQIGTDRPAGIAAIYQRLVKRLSSEHEAEHRMIEPLAELLWEAQRSGLAADERAYLERLRRL